MLTIKANYGKAFANPDEMSTKFRFEQNLYGILKF